MNCLLTTLKEDVIGNLPFIDSVRIEIDATQAALVSDANRVINLNSWEANKLSLKNIGGTFLDSNGQSIGTEITITSFGGDNYIRYSANTKIILIVGKHYLRDLAVFTSGTNAEIATVNFDDLQGCDRLRQLSVGSRNQTGNIAKIVSTELGLLNINNAPVTGDIATLGNKPLTYFVSSGRSTVYGDFADWIPYKTTAVNVTYICDASTVGNIKINGVTLVSSGTYTLVFDGQGGLTYVRN